MARTSDTKTAAPALAEAIAKVEAAPESLDGWDRLEQLADELQRPDEVSAAYRAALERGLSKTAAPAIAERAVKFCQAWYIDTPQAMPELLGQIVAKYPAIDWAFERLVVLLTSAAKWDELLALHDRALSVTRNEKQRRRLLNDAANLAKDFADQPDRAADYLQELLRLDPDNEKLVTSLERLLERRERYAELMTLWRERIPKLPTEEARATRARIARISLEQLKAPDQAVGELRELVEENPGHADACAQLEQILALETAPAEVRREALSLLRKTYEIVERPEEVVRVLTTALRFVGGDDARALRREAGNRMAILGRDTEAIAQFAALLHDAPGDSDARKQLRQLARKSERRDLHADALLAAAAASSDAAEQVSLWLEAAGIAPNVDAAIDLYQRVLDSSAASPEEALRAAHQLDEHLGRAERDTERLDVLERLSKLEQSPTFRRQTLGEAARLAARLGDIARALTSWGQILEHNPGDHEALGASIDLLAASQRYAELVAMLRQRAGASDSPQGRRADLVRVARVEAIELAQPEAAIATWREVREELGEDAEVVGELDLLLSRATRWQEVGELLGGAVDRELGQTATRLVRLADVYRENLARSADAMSLYAQALALNPADAAARRGMHALLAAGTHAQAATEALWKAYRTTDEWEQQLTLTDARVAGEPSAAGRADIYAEAARIHEQRAADPAAALRALRNAVPLAPHRLDLRAELLRLAEATSRDSVDGWRIAVEALAEAASALVEQPEAAADLRQLQAQIAELRLGDFDEALTAHLAASELEPDDLLEIGEVARCAARAARWTSAGQAVVRHARLVGRSAPHLLAWLEEAAGEAGQWREAATGLTVALDAGRAALVPVVASQLYGKAADWQRDKAGDAAAAANAAHAAVQLTPDDASALSRLVALQRSTGGPELADTLLLIDRVGDERSLDALREAAAVAADDDERAVKVLDRLYKKAVEMWLTGAAPSGKYAPDESAEWAALELTERLVRRNERERAARLLLAAGELPMPPDKRAALNRRAAEQLVAIHRPVLAIDAYRRVLVDQRDDLDTIRKLAELCEREEAKSGSVALRERELELAADKEERLALRLANSQRAAKLEARSGRVESLLQNLEEQPGHLASIDALAAILDQRGHYGRLVDILEAQAAAVPSDDAASAALWARAADIAEDKLRDPERAQKAHRHVVKLTGANRSLDALARLHVDKGEFAEAAKWLTRRLESSAAGERVAVLLKLARTQQQAGRESEAVATLEKAFAEAPQSAEVRKQLLPLLRQRQEWRSLASALATSVDHAGDDATVLAYAREAAGLYYNKLEEPGAAVPVLRRAVALTPDDRLLKRMLGDGLRDAGQLQEARELLAGLVESFGRRGSHERAEAHLSLARVLHELGQHDPALEQLDIASKMDEGNVTILRTLAEQARAAGQLERAEAALRTLLLTARRLQASGTSDAIGTSEVLFELSSIARARGQMDQAEELAESAIESLADNETRAPLLQKKLNELGEHDLLLRLLEARLSYVQSPFRRGAILGEKAVILSTLGRQEDAFEARLAAISSDPGSPLLHEGAREIAVGLDHGGGHAHLSRYVAHLSGLLERGRRDTDAMIRCELLLRLGEVEEKERGDYAKASELFDQAEATGVREVDVLRARARIAGARGDEEEQMRILEQLASLGEDQVETRADALYRIAEVQLAAAETLEQGIASLRKALLDNRNPARAGSVLRRATEQHPEEERLLDAYEQVARDSGDDAILLHYLERRATHASATSDQVREAVSKARDLGEQARAEKLMERAVEIGREAANLRQVDWALLGLAHSAKERGDVAGAVRWLEEAADVAEQGALLGLVREVADLAGSAQGDPAVAARLYEKLRERDPTARDAWQPLVDIYARLGQVDALERVVRETLDGLQEVADRNVLRVSLARVLLTAANRSEDAIAVLRDVLFDEPGHTVALELLTQSLEHAGRTDELVELLRDQLIGAQYRKDMVAAKATALRLGPMLDGEAASAVYRDALSLGDDGELLHALLGVLPLDHDPSERASLGERLLIQSDGAEAARLALELADAYAALGDAAGGLRVLEAALERAPDDEAVRVRLERHYREQGDAGGLARILEATAETAAQPARKVALWREAAAVHVRELNDATRAVQLLDRARDLAPDDTELSMALAAAMIAAGDPAGAIALLTQVLERAPAASHLTLLRARARARRAVEDEAGVIADLENAYTVAPTDVGAELIEALEDRRMRASMNDDRPTERETTLRLVEVLLASQDSDRAFALLVDWTTREADDVDALRRLRDLEAGDSRWEDLVRTCVQLVEVETGDEQAETAATLLDACAHLGTPDHARETLERVWAQQPQSPRMRVEIRRLYELIGANHELAKLLIEEAADLESVDEKIAHLRWAGEALLSVGDLQTAMPALTNVLSLKPDDSQARCLLSDANVMLGRFPEAHALLDEAIAQSKRSSPDLYMFHHRKAYVSHAEGDHYAQLESLKKAHQHARKNGRIASELADLAEALEQWDLAVATLRTITTIDADCPITPALALVRQGRIALRLGDEKRARLCARRAAMTDAHSEPVQAFLAELGES